MAQAQKNVLINLLGGAWGGLLIVVTTPWFVSRLGLEGFGLIGIWQLLFYLSLTLDFGLGTSCAREFARSKGLQRSSAHCRRLLALFETPVAAIALLLAISVYFGSSWLAHSWLNFKVYEAADVTLALQVMAISISLQFLAAFYANGLAGLQELGAMNAVQMLNNAVKYLGGAAILLAANDLITFFAFQAVAALVSAALARFVLMRRIGADDEPGVHATVGPLRQFARYSAGIFFTAVCGALLTNADRIAVSKLMSAEALGRYSVALTAIGLLQMLVIAFHRAYYPRFAQLHAAGLRDQLRHVYYQACALVGFTVIPVALVVGVFAPQLLYAWIGWSDWDTALTLRLLVFGFALSGVMWLPAAYQQATGWTRLHATLMAATLLTGVPLLPLAIHELGLVGASVLMVLHGILEITLGLWLMNRRCFPGENLKWYRQVIGWPLAISLPVVCISRVLMPRDLDRLSIAAWIGATCVVLLGLIAWWGKQRQARHQ